MKYVTPKKEANKPPLENKKIRSQNHNSNGEMAEWSKAADC